MIEKSENFSYHTYFQKRNKGELAKIKKWLYFACILYVQSMANSLTFLLLYLIAGCIATFVVIPRYIRFLYRHNLGKKIRENGLIGKATEFARLHATKIGTPTMGGGVILGIVLFMVSISIILQYFSREL